MKINRNYIERFIKTKTGYYYPLSRGLYLSFDKDGYYIGIEMFYLPSIQVEGEATKLLNKMISLDYIEIVGGEE